MKTYTLEPIGVVRSSIANVDDAPRFYTEGAPNAHLVLSSNYVDGTVQMKVGDEIIVITWLHLACRDVLNVHPRGDLSQPLKGVFCTRSPNRPNPLGLHRCTILAIHACSLHVGPIEAVDGTPVVDIKPVVAGSADY